MRAKYIKTIFVKDKFNPYKIKIYEYRNQQYSLEFDLYNNYLGIEIDVVGGHKNKQSEIDNKLDKPKVKATEDAEIVFYKWFDYCNGNENAFD